MSARPLVAELLGTAGLLLAVVGSGIATTGAGSEPVQLFAHAVVVGLALAALIAAFGHVSGAHFNPVVSAVDVALGGLDRRALPGYVAAQALGAVLGVVAANLLFGEPAVALATRAREGLALAGSEAVATAGLVVVIVGVVRSGRDGAVPGAVGAYIGAAIVFTPSTSLANPAVTVARTLSDTWTGIAPDDVPAFVLAQVVGGVAALLLVSWLYELPGPPAPADRPTTTDHAGVHLTDAGATTTGADMADHDVPTVLFLCVHNAGRSQMAAGWLRHLAGDRVRVLSAGSQPADEINPTAVEAMAEVGIDITGNVPQRWTDEALGSTDVVVTMGCGDECPYVPGTRYVDWELTDPAGQGIETVRPIRDDIEQRVRGLMAELDVAASA